MISLNRISAIVKKDLVWAFSNLKLLGIMVLPVFFVVLFSKIDGDSTFVFCILFVNAFVGLFTTSYLIIEEKNKGTLIALLTSPLKSHELLISKFLFTLLVCLSFSFLCIFLNSRFDIFYNPVLILNLLMYAGLTCFLGYTVGLFFKNEQELSIIAPVLMILFILGGMIGRTSNGTELMPFFPEYHLTKLFSSTNQISLQNTIVHSFFNLLYCISALLFATLYTKFYFSNSREKRISKVLFMPFLGFISLFFISGLLSPSLIKADQVSDTQKGLSKFSFDSYNWSGFLTYEPTFIEPKVIFQSKEKMIVKILNESNEIEVVLSVRKANSSENTRELREKKIRTDSSRVLLGTDESIVKDTTYIKWSYISQSKVILLTEAFCQDALLQISAEVSKEDFNKLALKTHEINKITKNLTVYCEPPQK